ncbi:MAG: hypothetical protein II877_08950, partial [Synergistaceae bacterium]|nr:hypothetical protein [Synergistaceae bacterium]
MTTRKITALVIMGALIAALSATTAFADYKTTLTLTLKSGSAVSNPTYDETYELTVPSSLRIANEGWNALGSMTVKYSGSSTGFNTAKKLVVTASSTNNFALKADGGGSISYFLATSEDDSAATTSFTFTAAQITAGASQDLGVNVGSFTGASDGTYTDEITYTVAIQDAGTTASVSDILTNGAVTVVKATVNGETSVSGTFTYNGSEFTASNVSGADSATAFVSDSNVQFDFTI